jgi:hypothetical protein
MIQLAKPFFGTRTFAGALQHVHLIAADKKVPAGQPEVLALAYEALDSERARRNFRADFKTAEAEIAAAREAGVDLVAALTEYLNTHEFTEEQ